MTKSTPNADALDDLDSNESTGVVVRADEMAMGECEGEFDDVALRLPYLQISHAMGKLEEFRKGSVILGDDSLIANPGQPIRMTILASRAYWKEYVSGSSYNPDYIPRTYATKAEVLENGGTTTWQNNVAPSFKIAIASKVIVEQPEGVICGMFGMPLGGPELDGEGAVTTMWAPAMWNVDKTAASKVGPIIKSDRTFSLAQRGLVAGIYELVTKLDKFSSGFSAYMPYIRLVGYHSDAVVAQILNLCGGAQQDVEVPSK